MSPGAPTESRAAALPLLGVLLLALVLRLHDIGAGDVWVDEANGILTASEPLPVLLDNLTRDSSPPLYYLLLHGWQLAFGDGGPLGVSSVGGEGVAELLEQAPLARRILAVFEGGVQVTACALVLDQCTPDPRHGLVE